jgi:hypothetical protein
VQLQLLQLCMVLVLQIWRLSLVRCPWRCSALHFFELLLQLAARVYLLVPLWLSEIILSMVKVLEGGFVPMDG